MKSYGRDPTFLALTGYEQVLSVAVVPARDHAESGACGGSGLLSEADRPVAGCCAPAVGYEQGR